MSNDTEIQMAVLAKHLPGVRVILSTGLPFMSERTARELGLKYDKQELQKDVEKLNVSVDGCRAVIDSQREEIAQLKAELKKAQDALALREMQLHEIAIAAQQFVERKDSETRAAQRDSRSAQEAMHRMWNEKLTGGTK